MASEATRGPWDPDAQHGGPPAALLGRAIEELAQDLHITRMTVEFLRPIPIQRVEVNTRLLNRGRRVGRFEAVMCTDGIEVARASALGIRRKELAFERAKEEPICHPGGSKFLEFPFFSQPTGYHTSVELRTEDGKVGGGQKMAWIRMLVPLLPDEDPSPLQRILVAADCGHGLSSPLDWRRYIFINPDLTVYTSRPAEGPWIGLHASTDAGTLGIGLTKSRIWDEVGPLGYSQQALLIDPRKT